MCDRSSFDSTSSVAPDSRLYCDGCRRTVDHRIRPDTVVAVLGRSGQRECLSDLLSVSTNVLRPQDVARHKCSRRV